MIEGHLIEEDPAPDPLHQPTLFEWAGGYPALLGLTRIFYSRYVPEDPLLGPLFAKMSPDHASPHGSARYSEGRRSIRKDMAGINAW